jgi:hypothetical protein
VSIVNSRALTIQGEKYLVPFADMFNYAPHKVTCVWVAMAMGAVFVRACARACVCVGGGEGDERIQTADSGPLNAALNRLPLPPCLCKSCLLLQATRTADHGAHFLKHHVLTSEGMTVLADRDTAAGRQLFEDYGDNDNSM